MLAQARSELRALWSDLTGWARATSRDAAGEARALVADLDAKSVENPGFIRRGWRRFRQVPAAIQVATALTFLGAWGYVLYTVYR